MHWPFCLAKCPYCDFNSHVRGGVDQRRWAAALVRELEWHAGRSGEATVDSVFFGGGTPSLMQPDTVAAVLEAVRRLWRPAGDLEVTLEANPTSVEAGPTAGLRPAGVERVSLGVQALDDASLRALGRQHSAAEAIAAVDLAPSLFGRASSDLISARPDQTVAAWQAELDRALALAADHLSLYQLTLEEGTPFHAAWRRGRLRPLDDDTQAAMYELTQAMTAAAGLPAYEISNHAAAGAQSRHNLVYWRYGTYAGVGPGAHGRLGRGDRRRATQAQRRPEAWLAAVEAGGHGVEEETPVAADERLREMLMMGLRLAEGVDLAALHAETGRPLDRWVPAARVAELADEGFLAVGDGRIAATAAGRQLLNALLYRLLG